MMTLGSKFIFNILLDDYDSAVEEEVVVYAWGLTQAMETLAIAAPSKRVKFLREEK